MIIPAIDLMEGKVVQLKQGKSKIFEDNELKKYVQKFKLFSEVNVIDLDAALGRGSNKKIIKKLCSKLNCNVGGGIRTKEIALEYLRAGAKNIIIGTNAKVDLLKELPSHRVIIALDLKKGKIAVNGWTKTIEANLSEKIKELENYCHGFLFTNVDVEGLNAGTDFELIKKISKLTNKRIIVAGGISSVEEVKKIENLGIDQVLGTAIYTGKVDLYDAFAETIDFSKDSQGLVPTIVQDESGQVLMLAYSNKESVRKTLQTRKATYFSRSRNSLWVKGETSGNVQSLLSFRYDCDNDSLLYFVKQNGVACHTGKYSCFSNKEFSLSYLLEYLEKVIRENKEGSYTVKLSKNHEKLSKKILEEAFEVTLAKKRNDQVWELADIIYFLTVYMAKNKIDFTDVVNELSLRHNKLLSCKTNN